MTRREAIGSAAKGLWGAARSEYLQRYHRLEIAVDAPVPDRPVMFVCNHGFGGIVDLNVLAFCEASRVGEVDRPITFLVHQIAWTLGMGGIVERGGGRRATREAAEEAVEQGHHLVVFPGGDVDAGKAFKDRNRIIFAGRHGFARLAQELEIPIVPVVTSGAGESLLVISDGKHLAHRLRLDRFLRIKALPVSLSLPWGINVGTTGLLPYLPLPSKLDTAVLAPIAPEAAESPAELAELIRDRMQSRLDQLVAHRIPVVG